MPRPRLTGWRKIALLTLLLASTAGCHVVRFNGAERWMQHPEAKAAARVAPHFTAGVLKEINRLEAELAKRQ
tara:strand:- start:1494 stop:1709 length:216 start_codon:yes stop_codon:yes gene_type:complete